MLLTWASQQGVLPPITVSDFKNGVYSILGVQKTAGDLWVENLDWASFNPATDIVPGTGLTRTSTGTSGRGPVASPELLTALGDAAPYEFTAVMEYSLTSAGGTARAELEFDETDLPSYTAGWAFSDSPVGGMNAVGVNDFAAASAFTAPSAFGIKKVAVLFSELSLAFSLNGDPTVSVLPNQTPDYPGGAFGLFVRARGDGVNAATATISKITLLPVVPLARLPQLSI